MGYRIIFSSRADKGLNRLSAKIQSRLMAEIDKLTESPHPIGSLKLTGSDNLHRVRVGEYRIIYRVEDDFLVVLVVDLGHRKDIYKRVQRVFVFLNCLNLFTIAISRVFPLEITLC